MSVLVRMPSSCAYVRQMKIIASVTSSILWSAKTTWVLTMRGHLSSHIFSVFHHRFSKLNDRSKGLCVSYTTVLVGTPSNGVCVRQMQIIVWVTSHILWGAKKGWVLPSNISGFPQPIVKVERPIDRSFSQLHISAGHNTVKWCMRPSNGACVRQMAHASVKWRMRPSNANHCPSDVMHTLGCQDEMGSHYERLPSEPYLRIPTTNFQR